MCWHLLAFNTLAIDHKDEVIILYENSHQNWEAISDIIMFKTTIKSLLTPILLVPGMRATKNE